MSSETWKVAHKELLDTKDCLIRVLPGSRATQKLATPVRGRNVLFDHLVISGGRIRANNRDVVSHP
jgi:hypothetical protein